MKKKDKYSYRYASRSRKTPVIVGLSAVGLSAVIAVGVIGWSISEENRIASLKYDYNTKYPHTFNTVESQDDDSDGDGVSNADELIRKTKGTASDSDYDGIPDGEEENFGTNPLNADTDGDGIRDGTEILAGLDPLSSKSDGVTDDSDRRFTRDISLSEGSVSITGGAAIYEATAEQIAINSVASNAGTLTFPYEIYSREGFDECEISLSYSKELIKKAEIDGESIKVFHFDPIRKEYEELDSVCDLQNGTVSAPVSENGVYVAGIAKLIETADVDEDTPFNVHLLIDNSGSMYPKSVQSTSKENDVDFKRLSFASKFVERLNDTSRVAVTAFTYDNKSLCGFTDDKDEVLAAIDSVKTLGAGFDGTSVERAIMKALSGYTKDMRMERNVIIMLTDGISTGTGGYTLENITAEAQAKNVTIMTISLGDEYDEELLQSIADHTGGKYFQISEANVLEGLYSTMLASIENNISDDDEDGRPDSYTLYDTGFRVEENGFSFGNFKSKTNETLDYGMVMLARDWFTHTISAKRDSENADISYDFGKTNINTDNPLRSVVLNCMNSSYLKPDTYLRFSDSNKKTLKVDKKTLEDAQSLGWSVRTMPYSGANSEWEEAEILYPNHTTARIGLKYSEDELQMLKAIHYYDSFRDRGYMFSLNSESDISKLQKTLGSGAPVVTKITWEENGEYYSRYVLLTALRRAIEDPNEFNLKVYDVNDGNISGIKVRRTALLGDRYSYCAEWDGKEAALKFSLAMAH